MAKATLYNQKGEKKGDVTLNKEMFEVPMNEALIKRMLQYQMNNARQSTAHTKTRGEVRGGGRKPFRQKGTGSARQGTIRAPHMRGGGVIFGPRNTRNFSEMMPRKQRRKALFIALSQAAADGKILAIDKYEGEVKTKGFAAMLKALPVERNYLVVIPGKSEAVQKSSANISNAKTILANYLNVFDVMKYKNIIFIGDALKKTEEVFLSKK
ncbi:50S ribosomal protein L4 [Candidatus Peregrinibacteria bacterium]|jgi:large subunit ribosomal protein L4|nr:50S ribosomal protein L4 [Candidatus Peregrinibacteria bacterium]